MGEKDDSIELSYIDNHVNSLDKIYERLINANGRLSNMVDSIDGNGNGCCFVEDEELSSEKTKKYMLGHRIDTLHALVNAIEDNISNVGQFI